MKKRTLSAAHRRLLEKDSAISKAVIRERGYWIEEDRWRGGHLFGIRVRDPADTARLAARLRERQVAVSVRGDAIRVAPNLYNDADDTTALLDALD